MAFSPQTVTLNGPGTASFTAAGLAPVEPAEFEFTATAGTFRTTSVVAVSVVLPPLQCSLSASSAFVSLAPGQSNSVTVTLTLEAGTPRPVDVVVETHGGSGSLFTVSGGGTLPEASGSVDFTVTAAEIAAPGSGSFRVRALSCGTTPELGSPAPELEIGVNVLGGFSFSGPASISLLRGQTRNVTLQVLPAEGFNAPIDLAYSCTAGDITVSGPPSLAAGQLSFDVELLASPTASPLNEPSCSVEGTSGSATGGVSFSILIGSFTLTTTAPTPIPLVAGTTPSLPITVTAEQGFEGDVTLTPVATNGIVVTPEVAVITGGNGTASFTLSAGPSAQVGSATVTVTGTAEGGLSAQLEQAVLVSDGFTLSSAPATFFLGNGSPLVVSIDREPLFTGDVRLDVGSLPSSIVSVTPTSLLVTGGTSSAAFEVVAGADPILSGQSASIPITGTFVPGAAAAGFGRAASEPVAQAATLDASGTLQAPFTLSSGGDLGTVEVGQSAGGSVSVGFAQGFAGSVQVDVSAPTGVTVTGGSAALTASGDVTFNAAPTEAGSFALPVTAQAGSFSLETSFSLTGEGPAPPPPPSFSLCVSKGRTVPTCLSSIDVNGSIPVDLRVKVVPAIGFASPVTISVQLGGLMQLFTVCNATGGGTISPPYTSSVNLCLTAGTPLQPATDSLVTFTGTPASGTPVSVSPLFNIGVPKITVTPDTFSLSPTSNTQLVDIQLSSTSGANVFNLPVTVFITGPNSALTGTGPVLDPLPDNGTTEIISSDCGPNTSGKTIPAGGGLVTCSVTQSGSGTFNSAFNLAVFAAFGPGGGVNIQLQRGCASSPGVLARCGGAQTQRISSGVRTQGADGAESDGKAGLVIAPESVQFTPLLPKPGDTVSIQATVENHTDADAENVKVGLVLNGRPAATLTVSVPAGGSQAVEFLWEAEYDPRLTIELSLDAGEDATAQTVPVRNFFVEPELAGTFNQGRSALEISNGECGGFRFVLGSQTFCGGSSDIELSPVITGEGQLQVQVFSLNGGIVDLGPQPITGQLTVPESGYAPKGWLEPGRLYAVESQGKYGLLYVSRIQSDIDPRLARLTGWQTTQVASLDDMLSDRLNDLLDHARITVVVEWAYLENGSRRFSYGFSGVERGPRPGVIRQPRVPATPEKQ